MEISFEHSLAWILPIIALAAALAWWVYFYKKPYEDWKPNLRIGITVLRFLVLAIVAVLLLKPFIVTEESDEEKPRLLVYLDESYSVDSTQIASVKSTFENDPSLSDKYKLEYIKFGEDAHFDDEPSASNRLHTDFGKMAESINNFFYNDNIGAIVVASDGIQTKGQNPLYTTLRSTAPVFTLALGDSSTAPDFELSQVLNNKLVFLGNDFQIKARGVATKLQGETAKISLYRNGVLLEAKEMEIASQNQALEADFTTTADKVGVNQYVVQIALNDAEINPQNNAQSTFIEVLDNRTKIKIIAKAPHPDLAAFKAAIVANEQYEVETVLLEDWDKNVESADLFLLHGLPTNAQDLSLISLIKGKQKPILLVFSSKVALQQFNALGLGLNITAKGALTEQVGASVNQDFNLFSVKPNDKIKRFPPLWSPFGEFQAKADHQVLLYQSIGQIKTDKPLLAFYNQGAFKTGVLMGEGWWKWRMIDEAQDGEKWTDQVVLKAVQYLALKQKRNRLNVLAPKQISERQNIAFKAELYNESYELVTDIELDLVVTDSLDNDLDYRFLSSGNAYQLNLGSLPTGTYKWLAKANIAGQEATETGEFIVTENKAEFIRTKADFNFMQTWAGQKGGEMFTMDQLGKMQSTLAELETAKAVIHTSRDWKSIIEWQWILFLIATLLTIEWFLRKFNGYY
ncbi:MAG: hypothetical protein NWR97_13170 [Salibacteraceae bacterium]|nr:hypothetical protein [Salibacteraceae bacterium]